MTNCCDTYGQCRQSDDCPCRTGVVLPHQQAHAKRTAADNPTPAEVGNVWFSGSEPTDDSVVLPLNEVWGVIALFLAFLFGGIACISGLMGYGLERLFSGWFA